MTDKALQRANELIQQHQICECGHLRWWSTNGKAGHWHTERGWCMECDCKEFRLRIISESQSRKGTKMSQNDVQCPHCKNDDDSMLEYLKGKRKYLCYVCGKEFRNDK